MLRRRIIPCLDVRRGRLVKGIRFRDLRDCGDPVDAAARYADAGADEIVWLNISAGEEAWAELLRAVERARDLLLAGADKVSVNTAALDRPELLSELAGKLGSQCVVVAMDAARANGGWEAHAAAGSRPTGRDVVDWSREAVERGAGELLVTSIDADGGHAGYDLDLIAAVSSAVHVPVVASGGAGGPADMAAALAAGASAALAASIFHDGEASVADVKQEVAACGIPVRA